MNKNEYRRAFIMLRAAMQGYAGHVRLERRTMLGSMYFVVTGPGDAELLAMLAGQRGGNYYAATAGALRRDRCGQTTLAWNFDPRSIDGRPLEAYQWVLVVRRTDGAVVLTGNVDGAYEMNLGAVRDAARALIAPADAPAADLPGSEEAPAPEPAAEADPPARETPSEPTTAAPVPPSEPSQAAVSGDQDASAPGDQPVAAGEACEIAARNGASSEVPPPDASRSDAQESRSVPEASTEPAKQAPFRPRSGGRARIFTAMRAQPETAPETSEAELEDAPAEGVETVAPSRTAAEQLGLDITRPWPGTLESLRQLFATQTPQDAPWDDGYTYVRAPIPGSESHCLIGLRASGGAADRVRYAVPGRCAPEPPAGLEGYAWSGDGYWTLTADAEGVPVEE